MTGRSDVESQPEAGSHARGSKAVDLVVRRGIRIRSIAQIIGNIGKPIDDFARTNDNHSSGLVGHLTISALILALCAMRFTRHILAFAVLALYVAQVVGGQSVHLWQCTADESSCCGESHCHGGDESLHHNHGHVHGHSHSRHSHAHTQVVVDGEQQPADGSPADDRRHDSTNCQVCQILGQPQAQPVVFTLAVSTAVTIEAPPVDSEVAPSPSRSGFQSRAPPVA